MRKPLIAGNWKLHKTRDEAVTLVTGLKEAVAGVNHCDILVAPPFTALAAVEPLLAGTNIQLGAQNCYPEASGAFTGEISPQLLKEVGCSAVIVGHSERRQLFNEDDALINRKVKAVVEAEMLAILCVGETLEERDSGAIFDVLSRQLKGGLADLDAQAMFQVVIAYEPVWAIGTGKTASNDEAQEVHSFLRGVLLGLFDQTTADNTRILYGGSVKPDNIDGLMAQDDIDGALVGGASLHAADFSRIVGFG